MCTTTMRTGSLILLLAATGVIIQHADGAGPSEVSLSLGKASAYTASSFDEIKLGEKQVLQLTAKFPEGSTTGVTIELLPSIKPTIFALGDIISQTVGGTLTAGTATWYNDVAKHPGEDTDATDSVVYNTRAVFSLGDVTNTNPTDEASSTITIEFEVVFVSMGTNTDGSEFWTSVGMEYDNGQYIWISQISFTLKDKATVNTSPSCTWTPPTTMTVNEKKVVELEIALPIPSATVTVEASVMADGAELFIPKLEMDTVGAGFSYSVQPGTSGISFKDNFAACPNSALLSHKLGTLINKEYTSSTASDHVVKMKLTLQASQLAAVGKEYKVAAGVDVNNNDIFVSDFNITVAAESVAVPITTFTAAIDGSATVAKGQIGRAHVDIAIPDAFGDSIDLVLETKPVSAATAAASILAVSPIILGENVDCPPIVGELVRTKTNPGSSVYDGATYTFNVKNLGWNTAEVESSLRLLVVFLMGTDAVENDQHELVVKIGALGPETVLYTTGTASSYPNVTSVDYTFNVDASCSSSTIDYDVGSLFAFKITMTTERGVTAGGPMTLETSIPTDLNNANIHFKSASVISKGKNVVCMQEGPLTPTLSDWKSGSGENDRAVQTFDMMCNHQVVDNTTEDVAVIEIVVYVKDNAAMLLETPNNETFGVGIKFSQTQIWVASALFTLNGPNISAVPTFVTGVTIPAGQQLDYNNFPGDLTLQWSVDGLIYRNSPFGWKSPGNNQTTSWEYTLEKPILTKYMRLVNTKTAACRVSFIPNNDAVGTNVTFYGNSTSNHLLQQRLMLALDNDNSTCFNLPQRTHTETAPFVWLNMKTYHLGVDGTNAYSIHLVGQGLSCNTPNGPQVTKMMYPKTALADKRRMKCKNTGELLDGDVTTCTYSCACSGAAQCEDLGILMYHKDLTVTGNYTLCSLWATQ